jgi:hypothetical protein
MSFLLFRIAVIYFSCRLGQAATSLISGPDSQPYSQSQIADMLDCIDPDPMDLSPESTSLSPLDLPNFNESKILDDIASMLCSNADKRLVYYLRGELRFMVQI